MPLRRTAVGLMTVLTLGLAATACGDGVGTPSPSATRSTARPSATASASSSEETSTPSADGVMSCDDLAAGLSRSERVGQLFMVAVSSSGMTDEQARLFNREHVGSVLLLGNSVAGRSTIIDVTNRARDAIDAPDGTRTMLAGDQEGGEVQRFRGTGFDRIPAARDQADVTDATLASRAQGWGRQLREAGIDADLAPVADLVPTENRSTNQPIGQLRRDYGSDPEVVAAKVTAFTTGMGKAGVVTSVKHFPGLGRVTGNTDTSSKVRDTVTTGTDDELAGFVAGTEAGADMVMVSSAIYTKIDAEQPAAFSQTVMRMLRRDLDFDGVIISDDMAGAALAAVPPGERILRFTKAGGDVAIVGDSTELASMAKILVDTAAEDPEFDTLLTRSVSRVLAMKSRHNLADCTPD